MTVQAIGTIAVAGSMTGRMTDDEATVHAWVVTGSGLDADHVIWADRGRIPQGTYISLNVIDGDGEAMRGWERLERVGGQVLRHVRNTEMWTLEIICYQGPETGDGRPEVVLRRVMNSLALTTVQSILTRGKIGITKIDKVRIFPGKRGVMFDPRARTRVMMYTTSDITETISEIAHVEATYPGPTGGLVVTVDRP